MGQLGPHLPTQASWYSAPARSEQSWPANLVLLPGSDLVLLKVLWALGKEASGLEPHVVQLWASSILHEWQVVMLEDLLLSSLAYYSPV